MTLDSVLNSMAQVVSSFWTYMVLGIGVWLGIVLVDFIIDLIAGFDRPSAAEYADMDRRYREESSRDDWHTGI